MSHEIETKPESISSIAGHYRINAHSLCRGYKESMSDYPLFYKQHKEMFEKESFVFPQNFGKQMGIDETSLFGGDMYTILINKEGKGRQGTIAAIVKGTKAGRFVDAIEEHCGIVPKFSIEEITMDFSLSMDWIARQIAPNAQKTCDRFHAEQLISEAVQSVRVEYRWAAIEKENKLLAQKGDKAINRLTILSNGETERQLLARSRGLLFKSPNKWTKEQKRRAEVLFELFPKIKQAHTLYMSFKASFSMGKLEAKKRLKKWITRAKKSGFKQMEIAAKTIESRLGNILNYLDNKATNAQSENFNAKIKSLLAKVRGVNDKELFLFRLFKLYG